MGAAKWCCRGRFPGRRGQKKTAQHLRAGRLESGLTPHPGSWLSPERQHLHSHAHLARNRVRLASLPAASTRNHEPSPHEEGLANPPRRRGVLSAQFCSNSLLQLHALSLRHSSLLHPGRCRRTARRAVPRACRGCRIHFHASQRAKAVPRIWAVFGYLPKCIMHGYLRLVASVSHASVGWSSQRWDDAGCSGTVCGGTASLDSGCTTLFGGSPERVSVAQSQATIPDASGADRGRLRVLATICGGGVEPQPPRRIVLPPCPREPSRSW